MQASPGLLGPPPPPIGLRHFYGYLRDLPITQARLNFSKSSSLEQAEEVRSLRELNVSVPAMVDAVHEAVLAGYPHVCFTVANDEQACLLDNFVAHLSLAPSAPPLLVACAGSLACTTCQTLSHASATFVRCVPVRRAVARVARASTPAERGGLVRTA
eukprot:6042488-Prymnesium_polylepis.1